MKCAILILNADTGTYDEKLQVTGPLAIRIGEHTYHLDPFKDGSLGIQRMERGVLLVQPVVNNSIILRPA